MNTLIALQIQINLLVSQISVLRSELPAADVAMVDWTPYDIATRTIPIAGDDEPTQ